MCELDLRVRHPEAVQAGGEPAGDVRGNAGNAQLGAFAAIDAGHGVTKLEQPAANAGG